MSGLPLPFNVPMPSLRALSLRHFLVLGFGFFLLLHLVFSFHSETYGQATSLSALKQKAGLDALAASRTSSSTTTTDDDDSSDSDSSTEQSAKDKAASKADQKGASKADPAGKAQMGADYEKAKADPPKEYALAPDGKVKAAFVMLARNNDVSGRPDWALRRG